jgi:hypothetical protein
MPTTNFFFNNQNFTAEQRLLDNLTVEMIKIYGVDVIYCPRSTPNVDKLFLEDPTSEFNNAIHIEMYIKNFEGWQGEGDMMSKFGITMSDQITLCVSRTRFAEDIGSGSPYDLIRPREGDLIFFPITNSMFEIKFVEHESTFYQTGSLQFFELKCERFNYSNENLETGIDEIDVIEPEYSFAGRHLISDSGKFLTTELGDRLVSDTLSEPDNIDSSVQNQYFEQQSNYIDFSAANPFSE